MKIHLFITPLYEDAYILLFYMVNLQSIGISFFLSNITGDKLLLPVS